MVANVMASRDASLDYLLEQVSLALQLEESKYKNAKEKYHAVGAWLADPSSPLSALRPEVYPQGSMLLQTTVKPRQGDEYDLDLVCKVKVPPSSDPLQVYSLVQRRLEANQLYAPILKPKTRCLRLVYAGDFHLDILPARPDPDRGGTSILVPDRAMHEWKESDPKAYGQWFESRCRTVPSSGVVKAGVEPLPGNGDDTVKPTLKRVVQLFKRHRDVVFEDDEKAPRSIVLTTLAAEMYLGEVLCTDGLLGVVSRINSAAAQSPGILEVRNPTNEEELFSEAWDWNGYAAFMRFVRSFEVKLKALSDAQGLPAIERELNGLFGESPTRWAVDAYTRQVTDARHLGALGLAGQAATIVIDRAPKHPIRPNTFYGQ